MPPPQSLIVTEFAPASSAFSTSSLSALAGRSTTSPAAIRSTNSDGSLLIDMLIALAQSEPSREALNLNKKIQFSFNGKRLINHVAGGRSPARTGGEI